MNVQKTPHTAQNRYKALYHNILHECGVIKTPHNTAQHRTFSPSIVFALPVLLA